MIDTYKIARAALDAVAQYDTRAGVNNSANVRRIRDAIAPLLAEMVAPPAPKRRSHDSAYVAVGATPKPSAEPEQVTEVVDLVAALRASVEAAKKRREANERRLVTP